MGPFLLPNTMYNYFMSYSEELAHDMELLISRSDINVQALIDLSASQERVRIFEKLVELIQEKDSNNDDIAVEVLSWAWQRLSS